MRYVTAEFTATGSLIDVSAYQSRLAELLPLLPPAARSFVSEPGHLEFDDRCVHDMTFDPSTIAATREIHFFGNRFKHPHDLHISYTGEVTVTVRPDSETDETGGLWEVMAEEILPVEGGCTHELVCWEGTVLVSCSDLSAQWVPRQAAPET